MTLVAGFLSITAVRQIPNVLSNWIGILFALALAALSLHRALVKTASAKLLDSIFRPDRDRSFDEKRIIAVRISAFSVFVVCCLFLYYSR
jgi:hypothetical protein